MTLRGTQSNGVNPNKFTKVCLQTGLSYLYEKEGYSVDLRPGSNISESVKGITQGSKLVMQG